MAIINMEGITMKKAELNKIINECYREFDERPNTDDRSWRAYQDEVRELYAIVRRHFGKSAAKKYTVAYFSDGTSTTFSGKMIYSQTVDALKTL